MTPGPLENPFHLGLLKAAAAVGTMIVFQVPCCHSTDDLYVLDLTNEKYKWLRVVVQGQGPGPRYGHVMDLVSQRYLVPFMQRRKKVLSEILWALDTAQKPYVWLKLDTGGDKPSARMYATACIALDVLDTAAGVWLDKHDLVTSSHSSNDQTEDPSLELMRRCRHATSSVGYCVYVYGGLRGDLLLDDFVVAENSPFHSDANNTSEKGSNMTTPRTHNLCLFDPISNDDGSEGPLSTGTRLCSFSLWVVLPLWNPGVEKEVDAAHCVWQAAQSHIATPNKMMGPNVNSQAARTTSEGSDTPRDVQLHPRAVVIAREAVENLGGLVRQLSLDHLKMRVDVLATLLKPRNWIPPADRRFFLDAYEVGELCYAAEQIFISETTILQLKAPIKVFGDLHGQFTDLMRLFDEYGFPYSVRDIT
ncbi:Kelch-type beta propeller containing protein [Tanacetum coccineum]